MLQVIAYSSQSFYEFCLRWCLNKSVIDPGSTAKVFFLTECADTNNFLLAGFKFFPYRLIPEERNRAGIEHERML